MSPNTTIKDELTGLGSAATRYQLRKLASGACSNCGIPRGEGGTTYYCRPCADKKAVLAKARRAKIKEAI